MVFNTVLLRLINSTEIILQSHWVFCRGGIFPARCNSLLNRMVIHVTVFQCLWSAFSALVLGLASWLQPDATQPDNFLTILICKSP